MIDETSVTDQPIIVLGRAGRLLLPIKLSCPSPTTAIRCPAVCFARPHASRRDQSGKPLVARRIVPPPAHSRIVSNVRRRNCTLAIAWPQEAGKLRRLWLFLQLLWGSTSLPERPTERPALLRVNSPWRWGFALGLVALALAITVGIPALREQPPTLLFFAAVVLTSWYGDLRSGLFASLLAMLALEYFFVEPLYSLRLESLDLVDFCAFAGVTWLVSTLQTRWRRVQAKLIEVDQELQLARQIQQRLFPAAAPATPGCEIAGICRPASATGGDFFDYLPMPREALGVVVGDVSGHGLGPALVMALLHAYLRTLARTHNTPDEILTQANRLACDDMEAGQFATVLLVCLEPQSRRLTYAGAGHEGYLVDAHGEVTRLASTGLPLGIVADEEIACGPVWTLEPGQIVLLISDGILEAPSAHQELFGLERTIRVVQQQRERPAREIAEALCDAALAYSRPAPPTDDMTVVVIKV